MICSARPRVSNRDSRCRLCGRHPLEQVAPADKDAEQRAHHRIDHDPGLMREEGDEERTLQQAKGEIAAQRAQMIAQRNARAVRHDAVERRQQRGHRDGRKDIGGPDLGRPHRQQPADQHGEKRRRRRKRAAQIV